MTAKSSIIAIATALTLLFGASTATAQHNPRKMASPARTAAKTATGRPVIQPHLQFRKFRLRRLARKFQLPMRNRHVPQPFQFPPLRRR